MAKQLLNIREFGIAKQHSELFDEWMIKGPDVIAMKMAYPS